jgi:hypothetical protein
MRFDDHPTLTRSRWKALRPDLEKNQSSLKERDWSQRTLSMKKTSLSLMAAGLATAGLMLVGCVHSLNPLFTNEDLTFEPKLLGLWSESDTAKERWTFEQAGDQAYKVTYQEDDKKGVFDVHLLRLGQQLYLDFFPNEEAMKNMDGSDLYKYHWLPVHTFARVYQVEPELAMAFMDPDWLDKHLANNPDAIAHVRRGDDDLILTASTKALQEFVRKYSNEAFGDGEPDKLRKINPAH